MIRCGNTGAEKGHRHVMEFSLKLDSNPEFTASVLVACARAVVRMNGREIFGCKTLFDVPPADLAFMDADVMRKKLL